MLPSQTSLLIPLQNKSLIRSQNSKKPLDTFTEEKKFQLTFFYIKKKEQNLLTATCRFVFGLFVWVWGGVVLFFNYRLMPQKKFKNSCLQNPLPLLFLKRQ